MNAHWAPRALQAALRYATGLPVTSYPPPAALYLALSVTSADPDGPGFDELAVTGYARQLLAVEVTGAYVVDTTAAATFAALGAGSYLGVGVFDDATAGELWYWADLDVAVGIAAGETVDFAAGLIRVALTG